MKTRFKNYILICILSIIVCIPLFFQNIDIYVDDGIQHICRLMGTYQSITEKQTFPVIMSNFCNGFGYSWNLFYSPLTAYVPLLFYVFTNSFVICLKAFMILVTIASGIAMYEFIHKVTKNPYAGLIGAAIYIFAPYRLADMYMRVAVAELTSFIFLPMVFHGLYNIYNLEIKDEKKSGLLLAVGACGLILTHIVMAMYTAMFCLVYVLVNIRKLKNKTVLKKLGINILLILCITSFYLLPMLELKLETNYEVFKPGRMEREEALIYYKLDLEDLFYTKQGQLITEIGLVSIIGFILSIFGVRKLENKTKTLYIFSLFAGIISIIMTLKWFPFEKLPAIFKMLQFSFRMLEFSSFFLAILAAINYSLVIKNFKMKDVLILTFLIILLIIPLKKNLTYRENFNENRLWPAVAVTQNTKRVHAGCASFEYLPSKAFEHLEYIKTRNNQVYVTSGDCVITEEKKEGSHLSFHIQNVEENTVLELPYIYYPGYEAVIQNNEEKIKLETYESENGFIEIHLENNIKESEIIVEYTGTTVMKISMVISILGFSAMIIYYVINKIKTREDIEI